MQPLERREDSLQVPSSIPIPLSSTTMRYISTTSEVPSPASPSPVNNSARISAEAAPLLQTSDLGLEGLASGSGRPRSAAARPPPAPHPRLQVLGTRLPPGYGLPVVTGRGRSQALHPLGRALHALRSSLCSGGIGVLPEAVARRHLQLVLQVGGDGFLVAHGFCNSRLAHSP